MPRWTGDARERLSAAALRLFVEHGYAATTVDDVAAAAGVTQRTFFRHFRDKEEVLFADDEVLLEQLVASIGATPSRTAADAVAPAATMREVLGGMAGSLEPRAEELRARAGVIATDVRLAGRELSKQTRWRDAVAAALRERGYEAEEAELFAAVGFAVFHHALELWLAEPDGPGLRARVRAGLDRLSALGAGT